MVWSLFVAFSKVIRVQDQGFTLLLQQSQQVAAMTMLYDDGVAMLCHGGWSQQVGIAHALLLATDGAGALLKFFLHGGNPLFGLAQLRCGRGQHQMLTTVTQLIHQP